MSDVTVRANKATRAKFLPSKAEVDEAKSIQAEVPAEPAPDTGPTRKPLFGK